MIVNCLSYRGCVPKKVISDWSLTSFTLGRNYCKAAQVLKCSWLLGISSLTMTGSQGPCVWRAFGGAAAGSWNFTSSWQSRRHSSKASLGSKLALHHAATSCLSSSGKLETIWKLTLFPSICFKRVGWQQWTLFFLAPAGGVGHHMPSIPSIPVVVSAPSAAVFVLGALWVPPPAPMTTTTSTTSDWPRQNVKVKRPDIFIFNMHPWKPNNEKFNTGQGWGTSNWKLVDWSLGPYQKNLPSIFQFKVHHLQAVLNHQCLFSQSTCTNVSFNFLGPPQIERNIPA